MEFELGAIFQRLMELVPEPRSEAERRFVNSRQLPAGAVDHEAIRAACADFAADYERGMAEFDRKLSQLMALIGDKHF